MISRVQKYPTTQKLPLHLQAESNIPLTEFHYFGSHTLPLSTELEINVEDESFCKVSDSEFL